MVNKCLVVSALVVVLAGIFQFTVLNFRVPYIVHPAGVVLITGTSTGIGRHAVFELALLNYTVFGTVRNQKDADSLLQEAVEKGLKEGLVRPVVMDVTNKEQIDESFKEISTFTSANNLPFVALVNNAGISLRAPVEVSPADYVRKMFDINFFGAVEVTQKFLPLIRRDKGRIIFISSLAGVVSLVGNGLYAATKRAIEGLTDSLRLEMHPFEVSVTSILPGYVKTAISEKAIPKESYLTSETDAVYSKITEELASQRRNNFESAPGPDVTSAAIVHSITSPYPQTRYYVGSAGDFPAWAVPLLSGALPDRLIDFIKIAKDEK